MILETREELLKQLTESWNILIDTDAKLEDAIDHLMQLRKDIRNMKRASDDQGPVRGAARVDATSILGTRADTQTDRVSRLPT